MIFISQSATNASVNQVIRLVENVQEKIVKTLEVRATIKAQFLNLLVYFRYYPLEKAVNSFKRIRF